MSFSTQGPSSSQAAYLVPNQPNVRFAAIITSGDTAPGGAASGFVGVPDGIGAYDNGNGTSTVLVNHEIGGTAGVVRAHGFVGSFVSKATVNNTTLAVTSLTDLATQINVWDSVNNVYVLTTTGGTGLAGTGALTRLCSGDLPDVTAYFNAATGRGTTDRIYMAGEEAGVEGRSFAWVATGAEAGRAFELPRFGNFSVENLVARPIASDKTVVMGMDDGTGGQVYFYIGDKQNTGTAIERAGLTNGGLYGIKADFLAETSAGRTSGTFTLASLGNVQNLTGAQLEIASNVAGVTNFLRPEDGAWDTVNPNRFYFQTTNAFNQPSRLWALDFIDPLNPALGGNITAVLNGTEGQQMLDNLAVTKPGSYLPFGTVIAGEDVGNNARTGRVYSYDAATDTLTTIARHNPALFGDDNTAVTAPFTIDEESSGMVDVTAIFGNANTNAYLIDTQAHFANSTPGIVEGGQLMVMYVDRPVSGGTGDDDVRGGWFSDTLNGGAGNDTIRGGDGNDMLAGDAGNDSVVGGNGNDMLFGGAGTDTLVGGLGDDSYVIEDTSDIAIENAGEGSDTAVVTASSWTSGGGIETIYLIGGSGLFTGSADNELIVGNSTSSTLFGADGNDTISGGAGVDSLFGQSGNDELRGGGGNDVLFGGFGNDQLIGGTGADTFVFGLGFGNDVIHDFNRIEGDRIDMRGTTNTFANLSIGSSGGNSVVIFGTSKIDVYGVTNLATSDFIFS